MKRNYVRIICTIIYFILMAMIIGSIVGVILLAIFVHPYAIILIVPAMIIAPVAYILASKILMFPEELEAEVYYD